LKVLLIEDDEDDYILTAELLKEIKLTSYDITWIPRYADAVTTLASDPKYDICLIDYRLGEGDGISLIREARDQGCRMPMILLTGQGDSDVDLAANAAGAADYLVKGDIDGQLLERAIRYAVANAKVLASLAESEIRFRSIIESATDAIVLTDSDGRVISWNPGAERTFGYLSGEILGMPIATLFTPEYTDIHTTNPEVNALASAGLLQPGTSAVEIRGVRRNGSEVPLEVSVSSWDAPAGTYYCGIIRDITERKSLEDQLTHQALHDPLTKLPNRVLFKDRVEHALTRAVRRHAEIAVLFIDLDNFKTVNDTMGHAAGDVLLNTVAERLQACLRSSDTASRLGGDEFAVLIEDTSETDHGSLVAHRLLEVIRKPIEIDGHQVFVGASIGIAVSSDLATAPATLLRNADVAMYIAKSQGKNQFAIFENEMHNALIKRSELENDLRSALSCGEFEMAYQPIMDLDSGSVVAMEALVRWNHPRGLVIGPNEFIPIAEEARLMGPLGAWILEQSCVQAASWNREYYKSKPISIAVNVSSRQFLEDSLIGAVRLALESSRLDPHNLILEITEGTMLKDTETTVFKLKQLRELGVRLAIDDFGTGYSSLSYLHKFPINLLKIDKSFIEKINNGREGAAMARAIISMSETLHLGTIAEGIENSEQIVMLQGLGCEMGQGYHFAKPLNAGEMSAFLREKTNAAVVPFEDRSEESVVVKGLVAAGEPIYHF
jgi:diguanylate cyclase (GGDEF)-like protein/PAS domain S-box-containing protein